MRDGTSVRSDGVSSELHGQAYVDTSETKGANVEVDEVRSRIRMKIGQVVSIPESRISSDLTLKGDLPFDSLQLYELAAELEDEFGLPELDEDDVAGIETVGDVEQRVLALLSATAGADS